MPPMGGIGKLLMFTGVCFHVGIPSASAMEIKDGGHYGGEVVVVSDEKHINLKRKLQGECTLTPKFDY